jgi:hypothetical protein
MKKKFIVLSVLFSVLAVPVSAVESPAPVVVPTPVVTPTPTPIVESPTPVVVPTPVVTPTPTPAVNTKPIVIIDSYFDTRVANATIVCIATDKCVNTPKPSKRVSDPVNHGMAMAEVARRNNPNVPLVLLRSANVDKKGAVGILNGNDFLAALKWVDANSSNVSAVSFSYGLSGNMTKPGDCKLSPTGLVNVKIVDPAIRATVASLKNKGIPVFVSTGNDSNRKPVAYPACITDTVSVSTFPVGNHDQNTDYFGVLPTGKFNYGSVLFGLIPQTTSSANVAVATQWQKGLTVTDKLVLVSE